MRLTRCLLRPGGLLLLTVPIGPDVVVYNLHRRSVAGSDRRPSCREPALNPISVTPHPLGMAA
jgi:hypothetical protein